jgi:phage terminase large subunit
MIGDKVMTHGPYVDPAAYQVTKANPISVAHQYRKHGLSLIPSRRTQVQGEMHAVYHVKELLKHRQLFVSESCQGLIREFNLWGYKRDQHGRPMAKDQFQDRNNDHLDAMRYYLTMYPTWMRAGEKGSSIICQGD